MTETDTTTVVSPAPAQDVPAASTFRRYIPRGVLAGIMLVTGAAGLMYEYILSTVFTYIFGSSSMQWAITIGIMLFFMGMSGLAQLKLKGPLAEYFVIAELLLVVLGGFGPIVLQATFATFPDVDFTWIKFFYPLVIGALIGIEIPLAMRINRHFTSSLSGNIAGTWAWDYMGCALGLAVWVWALRHYVPLAHLSFWVAGCNLLVAIGSLMFFWRCGLLRWKWSGPSLSAISALVIVLVVFGASHVDAWGKLINQKMYEDPIALEMTTKYQNIVLTKGPHPVNPHDANWQLWLNGNKQFSSLDEAVYHELLVHPAMNLAAGHRRVLILGGGDGMALREVLKYPDVQDVTLVDLDPDMIKLGMTHPVLKRLNNNAFGDARVHSSLDDPNLSAGVTDTGQRQDLMLPTNDTTVVCHEVMDKGVTKNDCKREPVVQKAATVNVYTLDADKFVSVPHGWYDVVIVDLPDPNSSELAKLYSKEFYTKVKQAVSPQGIVVVQAASPYHAKETYLCIVRTMAAAGLNVIPYHENVPSFGDWGWVLGSPSLPADTLYDRADNLPDFKVHTRKIGPANMSRALIFNKGELESRLTGISELMNPVVASYYLDEWKVE